MILNAGAVNSCLFLRRPWKVRALTLAQQGTARDPVFLGLRSSLQNVHLPEMSCVCFRCQVYTMGASSNFSLRLKDSPQIFANLAFSWKPPLHSPTHCVPVFCWPCLMVHLEPPLGFKSGWCGSRLIRVNFSANSLNCLVFRLTQVFLLWRQKSCLEFCSNCTRCQNKPIRIMQGPLYCCCLFAAQTPVNFWDQSPPAVQWLQTGFTDLIPLILSKTWLSSRK